MADDSLDSLPYGLSTLLCALFLLERAADKFVDNSAIVAKRLGVSPTLVALLTCGAEWEELVVIVVALGQAQRPLALGNLMGSTVANILGSFSLGLLLQAPGDGGGGGGGGGRLRFDRSAKVYTAFALGATVLFLVLLYVTPPGARWVAGAVLVVLFAGYVAAVSSMIYRGTLVAPVDDSDSDSDSDASSDADSDSVYGEETTPPAATAGLGPPTDDAGEAGVSYGAIAQGSAHESDHLLPPAPAARSRPRAILKPVLQLLFGLALMVVSGYVIARSAKVIGDQLGLSGTVTGTTLLSLATTLPEKFVAVMAGSRHQPGILVANTVGSNIFLLTLCAGVMFLWPVADGELEGGFRFTSTEALAMLASASGLLLVVLAGGHRWTGAVMLSGYLLFLVLEVLDGRRLGVDPEGTY